MKDNIKQKRRCPYDDDKFYEFLDKHELHHKRMISGSKSGYRRANPEHDIMFNANIFTPSGIWWNGDLDITKNNFNIQNLCDELEEEIIIVNEMLGWQGAENRSYEELEMDAHAKFLPNKKRYLRRIYDGLHSVCPDGQMTVITSKGIGWEKVPVKKFYEHYQYNPEKENEKRNPQSDVENC